MYNKRFFVEGLAQASYLFGSDGEAAVVDPRRDVDVYLTEAEAAGLKIVAVLETHPHADFASGHVELAERTGAKIYISRQAQATYPHVDVGDETFIKVGDLQVQAIETPGHSPDSISFLVRQNGDSLGVYTGDTLFAGDVGRPDLRDAEEKPTVLAEALYDSLFGKLLRLPPKVTVYPAHGAGSLCGRKISTAASTTIGEEAKNNWALQLKNRGEFVNRMTTDLPARPGYFSMEVALNLKGSPSMDRLAEPKRLSQKEILRMVKAGAVIIDCRDAGAFGEGHLPGSISIGLGSALFATWAGFMVPSEKEIILVVGSAQEVSGARIALARIGYDRVTGFIEGKELADTQELSQIIARDLKERIQKGTAPAVLDVRTVPEWNSRHIEWATHIPLTEIRAKLNTLNPREPLAVICGSGYRSSIAASLLQAAGFGSIQNVMGGMEAYEEARYAELAPADLVFLGEAI